MCVDNQGQLRDTYEGTTNAAITNPVPFGMECWRPTENTMTKEGNGWIPNKRMNGGQD